MIRDDEEQSKCSSQAVDCQTACESENTDQVLLLQFVRLQRTRVIAQSYLEWQVPVGSKDERRAGKVVCQHFICEHESLIQNPELTRNPDKSSALVRGLGCKRNTSAYFSFQ